MSMDMNKLPFMNPYQNSMGGIQNPTNNMPMNNVAMNNMPLNNIPMNNIPMNQVPMNNMPMNQMMFPNNYGFNMNQGNNPLFLNQMPNLNYSNNTNQNQNNKKDSNNLYPDFSPAYGRPTLPRGVPRFVGR